LLLPIIKFFDAKTIVVVCCGGVALFTALMAVTGVGSLTMFFVLMVARQSFGSCMNGSQMVLLTRAIDYGEWKFNIRQEGLGSSFQGAFQKMTMGISTAVLGYVLTSSGYDPGQGGGAPGGAPPGGDAAPAAAAAASPEAVDAI
jgi:GPH family glycoside/pentoside/hexuronide:cation symporter